MKILAPFFAALMLAPLQAHAALPQPVRVESGLVQGVTGESKSVVAFKGIPYAAPPIGDWRWRDPQPPLSWDGVRSADKFGAPCVQPPSPSGKAAPADMSEDCLFLNVWTSAQSAEDKLPVLFWIHGGAGLFGSGNINGEELAKKGIIVVSLNYRLGLFAGMGHPDLSAESPRRSSGTYGMLDLIAGLNWVQKNIAAFGGDAGKVTIAGQSSGASNVHYLVTSPVAKGLFRAAIGVSFPYDYLTKPHIIPFVRQKEENGVAFAKIKNAATLADLRKIPARELIANDPAVTAAKLYHLGSGAARDGWAFPTTYNDALEKGLANDVPTLTGFTADDFGPPAAFTKTTAATFAAALPGMFGENRAAFSARQDEFLALCPVNSDEAARAQAKQAQIEYRMASLFYWAKRRAKTAKTPVYSYIFEQCVPSERGAYHGSDLAYVFNDLKTDGRAWTEADRRVADEVSSYWANFVKTLDPNGAGLPYWAPFDAAKPVTLAINEHSAPRPLAAADRLDFYRALLDK